MRRTVMLREHHETPDPLWAINDKLGGYEFAARLGVDHPEVLGSYTSTREIDFAALPDRFVLKTRILSTNRGVKALVRLSGGAYHDLLRDRVWSVSELHADHARLEATKAGPLPLMVEELLTKPERPNDVVDDWKLYCFDGVVGLIMQRDLMGSPEQMDWRFKYWDTEFVDLGAIKDVERHDSSLEAPRFPDQLIEVAERLSRGMGRPFVRIDLLESGRGPLLGEFTPHPGRPQVFLPEYDSQLGRLWEQAEARIVARDITAGRWSHLSGGRQDQLVDLRSR